MHEKFKPPMTASQFREWRKAMGFKSREGAALALGISVSLVELCETGIRRDTREPHEISRTIALACAALLAGITEYQGPNETVRIPVYLHDDKRRSFKPRPADDQVFYGPKGEYRLQKEWDRSKLLGYLIAPVDSATRGPDRRGEEYLEIPGLVQQRSVDFAYEDARKGNFGLRWEDAQPHPPGALNQAFAISTSTPP